MMKNIFLLLLFQYAISLNAQEAYYKSYSWDKNPNYKNFETNKNENIMSFKDKAIREFYFNDKNKLVEYYIEHRLLWLNSDSSIEDYNKVYLPYNSSSELLINRARVITKEGKVLELDNSKILTAEDEETKKTYKYFAFEGVEKGSFIEYYYVVKKYPSYKGKRVFIQSSYDKKNVEFDLYAPKNLIFEFKSYNGLTNVEQDTLSKEKLHWKLHLDKVDKLEKEEQSAYNASRKYLIYKLDRNTVNNTRDISSYVNVTKNIYKYLYLDLSKSETSSINKIIKYSKLSKEKDDESKIRALENYIKANYYITEINSEEYKDIKSVITNKTANEVGLIRIYIAALKSVGIKTEVVLTSDRFDIRFDDEFEADNFLNNYLLYFPSVKMFTSAKEINARLGVPPSELTDNYGLFIKEVALGNFKSGAGKIKYIDALSAEDTVDNLIIDVSFDRDNILLNNIKIDHTFSGYYASYIQPYLSLINKDDLNEFYDSLVKRVSESITINDKVVTNDKPELFGVKPFNLVANTESEAFVDKVGRKYLFKLGELIGPQMEMYQDEERNLPIESDFNRSYERIINVELPKGYSVANLDDINIDNFYEKEGKKLLEFNSYYELKENKLTVYANEYYKINRIDIENYEDYRKVINSAADFNKIILVLEPNSVTK